MKTRHEAYSFIQKQLPCGIFADIYRTAGHLSDAANWHGNPELQLCLAGSGYVLIDGRWYSFEPGDVVIVHPNRLHFTGTDGQLHYACLIFDTAFCAQSGLDFSFREHVRDASLTQRLNELIDLTSSEDAACLKAKMQILVLQLLLYLHAHYQEQPPQAARDPAFETVKSAIIYIEEHFGEAITLDGLAGSVYTDKFALERNFKRLTGQTIFQFINRCRCDRARELIQSGTPVRLAAEACGFHDPSYFTRTYKAVTGRLPSKEKGFPD